MWSLNVNFDLTKLDKTPRKVQDLKPKKKWIYINSLSSAHSAQTILLWFLNSGMCMNVYFWLLCFCKMIQL